VQQFNGKRGGAILHAIAKQEKPQGSVVGVRVTSANCVIGADTHSFLSGGDRTDLFFTVFWVKILF